MKQKKWSRILVYCVALSMVFVLGACGDGDKDASPSTSPATSTSGEESTTAAEYTVQYLPGDEGVGEPIEKKVAEGEKEVVIENPFTRDGYVFAGWSDGAVTVTEEFFYTVKKDVTFTALWEPASSDLVLGKLDSLESSWQGIPGATLGTKDDGETFMQVEAESDIVFVVQDCSFDVSSYAETGTLHLSVYVTDPTVVVGGQIELTSSGGADANELSFGEMGNNIVLEEGWNELAFPLSEGSIVGGDVDFTNINYIRIYFNVAGGSTTVGIRNLYLSNDYVLLGTFDSLETGWIGSPAATIEANEGGENYMQVEAETDIVFMLGECSFDLSKLAKNGLLHLSVYVSNPEVVVGGQIELTSSGGADANELSFGELGNTILLTEGWNELYLPMNAGDIVGGDVNFEAINYIRIYFNVAGGSTIVGIRNLYIQ